MIRLAFIFVAFCIAGLALQSMASYTVSVFAPMPDFALILAVYLGLKRRRAGTLLAVFLLGILVDFAGGQYLGPHAAGMVAAAFFAMQVSDRIFAEHPVTLMMVAAFSDAIKCVLQLVIMSSYVSGNYWSWNSFSDLVWESLLTGVCAPIVCALLNWAKNKGRGGSHYRSSIR